MIHARAGDRSFAGFGETFVSFKGGEQVPSGSWRFSENACSDLIGQIITASSAEATKLAIHSIMERVAAIAGGNSADHAQGHPFGNTVAAISRALTDLAHQAIAGGIGGSAGPSRNDNAPVGNVEAEAPAAARDPSSRQEAVEQFFQNVLTHSLHYVSFPPPPLPSFEGRRANTYEGVNYLRPLGANGTKGHLLEREALALGLSTVRYAKGTFLATDGEKAPLIFKWSRTPISSCVSLALCSHKEATRARMRREGVPAPRGRMFRNSDYDSARLFAERLGYPVVCKPATGVRGIGVVANIQNDRELNSAFEQLAQSRLGKDDFIVEKHVTGSDYRIVVLDGKVIAAILREPASVVGDGERTIAELMLHKNAFRRLNPHLWGRPIKYDLAARYQLERANLRVSSVPDKAQRVVLANSCSLSQGGDSIDVLEELHPSVHDAAVAAVRAVPGLGYCGLDLLIEDHRKPIGEQSAGFCELNAHAAIGNCEYPLFGEPRQVARQVMDFCVRTYGLRVRDAPAERLSIKINVRGGVTGVGYRKWIHRLARQFDVDGWVRNVSGRSVEAVLVGETAPVSALAAAAVTGPEKATPTSVRTGHTMETGIKGFEIRDGSTS